MASQGAGSWLVWLIHSAARRYSVSLMSVDLPEPDTPVTQVIRPSGSLTVMFLQIVAAGPADREPELVVRRLAPRRQRDLAPARTGTGR